MRNWLAVLTLLLAKQGFLAGQTDLSTSGMTYLVPVPFVGCESDGQVGPIKAPNNKDGGLLISHTLAPRLAYYKAEEGFGVLAPRGWHCFETYGSNGENLFVSPDPINREELLSTSWKGFAGPAIQISSSIGDT